MIIHRTRPGETALSVAKKYGAEAETLARDNGITPRERLATGRELLVLPRRRGGESRGAGLALGLLIGFFYPGCRPEDGAAGVRAAVLSEYVIRHGGISRAGSCGAARREAVARGADIFSRYFLRELPEGETAKKLARMITEGARERADRGVAISGISAHAGAGEFLLTLKRECMARDLAMMAELTPEMTELSSVPDIVVLTPNEAEGAGAVCRALADFAERGESSSAVIDITPLTLSGGRGMTAEETVREADRRGGRVETDDETLLSRVMTGRQSALFPSLAFTCRVAREAERLGYPGLCIDGCRAGAARLTLAAYLCSGA